MYQFTLSAKGVNCCETFGIRFNIAEGEPVLFLLTGEIQTGKTRWLENAVGKLSRHGVAVEGVIAPGVWRCRPDGSFEKLGIDNVLLPNAERFAFARRCDPDSIRGECAQSRQAGLGWAISDRAIAHVDAHFAELSRMAATYTGQPRKALLVIDEIGKLELECAGGITHALSMLDNGATPAYPHALAVVRPDLLEIAQQRFSGGAWNGLRVLRPKL